MAESNIFLDDGLHTLLEGLDNGFSVCSCGMHKDSGVGFGRVFTGACFLVSAALVLNDSRLHIFCSRWHQDE